MQNITNPLSTVSIPNKISNVINSSVINSSLYLYRHPPIDCAKFRYIYKVEYN